MWEGVILILLGLVLGGWMITWIRRVPAIPPHIALLTFLGERIKKIKKEGIRIFWGYPLFYNYIPIDIETKRISLKLTIRTQDLAQAEVPIEVEFIPSTEGELLINYLNRGGEEGIKKNLEDVINERFREWIFSLEGPQSPKELMASREIAVYLLLKAIVGTEQFQEVPSLIPTPILFKYYSTPRKTLTPYEFHVWGNKKWVDIKQDWQRTREEGMDRDEAWLDVWQRLTENERWGKISKHLEEEKEDQIKKALKEREEAVKKVREGRGELDIEPFGIRLLRLNIGEIKPIGGTAEAMEFFAKEEQERRGEVFEVETDTIKARRLTKAAKDMRQEISFEKAYQIIQEWKATREGRGYTIPGLSPILAGILETIMRGGKK